MKRKTSVATILFPKARHSFAEMEQAISYLSGKVNMAEFYYEGSDDRPIGRLLEQKNMEGVFIAVIPLKEQELSLCSPDEANRAAAVKLVKTCVDRARLAGCHALMVCSGKNPADAADVPRCTDTFIRSMREVIEYETAGSSERLKFLLEPCDSGMDARHLLGPTPLVVEVARHIRELHDCFGLTMDTAHVAEEGEDFMDSMKLARPYCHHVHFANYLTKNPADPFYGDKHVDFDYPGSDFTYPVLEKTFRALEIMYADDSLSIALESLCRAENAYENFEKIMANMPWFFERK